MDSPISVQVRFSICKVIPTTAGDGLLSPSKKDLRQEILTSEPDRTTFVVWKGGPNDRASKTSGWFHMFGSPRSATSIPREQHNFNSESQNEALDETHRLQGAKPRSCRCRHQPVAHVPGDARATVTLARDLVRLSVAPVDSPQRGSTFPKPLSAAIRECLYKIRSHGTSPIPEYVGWVLYRHGSVMPVESERYFLRSGNGVGAR